MLKKDFEGNLNYEIPSRSYQILRLDFKGTLAPSYENSCPKGKIKFRMEDNHILLCTVSYC